MIVVILTWQAPNLGLFVASTTMAMVQVFLQDLIGEHMVGKVVFRNGVLDMIRRPGLSVCAKDWFILRGAPMCPMSRLRRDVFPGFATGPVPVHLTNWSRIGEKGRESFSLVVEDLVQTRREALDALAQGKDVIFPGSWAYTSFLGFGYRELTSTESMIKSAVFDLYDGELARHIRLDPESIATPSARQTLAEGFLRRYL